MLRMCDIKTPEDVQRFLDQEATRNDQGAYHWISSGNAVPLDFWTDRGATPPDAQAETIRIELREFVARYNATATEPDEETKHEMRAAFGEGAVVIDIISGKEIKL